MKRRLILALGLLPSILVVLCGTVRVSASDEWPTRWQVNGNGEKGTLEFTVDDGGALVGRLLDEHVEGFVSGRHLVIRRSADGRVELWEGWLAGETAGANLIVAGSISVNEDGETSVYPWFGTPGASEGPETPITVPASASAPSATSAKVAGAPLSGTWVTLTGQRMEIGQDGNQLTVISPDGSSHSGRVTGESSLVVGLRKGCCNGTLESPDVIVWSDGSRWQRAD
jgi:hypothetical protein